MSRRTLWLLASEGVVYLGLAPFVQRVIDEATQAGVAAVVLNIDTFGGGVDAAVQIRDALLNTEPHTTGFVDKRAISAGALIGLATKTLAMSTGSTIGAAAPVQSGAPGAAGRGDGRCRCRSARRGTRICGVQRWRQPHRVFCALHSFCQESVCLTWRVEQAP